MESKPENISNRTILLLGGLIGLAAGLGTAYLLIRRQEKTGQSIKFSSSDGVKLGMNAVSLVKLISDIAIKPK
jgi:nitrate reductase gamma subunit